MRIARIILLGLAVAIAGCRPATIPDPNDASQVGSISAGNLYGQFTEISSMLFTRQTNGLISERQYRELLKEAAQKLLAGFDPDKVDVSKAYQVADVMVNAQEWDQAKRMLQVAVDWAKANHNEDRRVNDSLTLAQVEAELNQVPQAIATARSTFDVPPTGAAPILYGVLYKIVPAARGKGHDLELGQLLEESIAIDMKVVVDPSTIPGAEFLEFRPSHVRRAWEQAAKLYERVNRTDLAERAQKMADSLRPASGQRLQRA